MLSRHLEAIEQLLHSYTVIRTHPPARTGIALLQAAASVARDPSIEYWSSFPLASVHPAIHSHAQRVYAGLTPDIPNFTPAMLCTAA